jgi:phosphomannomutase
MAPYRADHYMSGELNYRVSSIEKVINAVKEKYSKFGKEDFTDGYSLETERWRFNIRPSNTEPLLRLNVEARDAHFIDEIRTEIEKIINE